MVEQLMFDDYAENQSRRSWLRGSLHRPHIGHRKLFFLSLFFILLIVGSSLFLNNLEAIHYTNIYNQQVLWSGSVTSGLPAWNTIRADYFVDASFGCPSVTPCIKLDPNNTQNALAISKSPVMLDTAGGHNLLFQGGFFDNLVPTGKSMAWFLTRNNTAPTENQNYSPYYDRDIALLVIVRKDASENLIAAALIQHYPFSESIGEEDTGTCSGSGSAYICTTVPANKWYSTGSSTRSANDWSLALNFTGTISGIQGGASILNLGNATAGSTCADSNHACSQVQPWLQFQGTPYYFGVWFEAGGLISYVRTAIQILRVDFSFAKLDTGGFFGPLIRALITLREIFVTVLDKIGQALGLGSIGTLIRNFFSDVTAWFSNVLAPAFAALGNLANVAASAISFLAGFFLIGPLLSFLALLATAWSSISGAFSFLNMLMLSGAIGLSYFFILNYIYGMFRLYLDGMDGFHKWLDMNMLILFGFFKAGMWLSNTSIELILQVKGLIFKWL